MGDVWVTAVAVLLRVIAFCYDVISFIPTLIVDNPKEKLDASRRIKARRVVHDEPESSFRSVDSKELTITLYPECRTLDQLLERAVRVYGPREAFGTRELISEMDEKQPNGKVFKKVILGQYRWLTYADVGRRLKNLGSGLQALGQKPRHNIVIFAETRGEWLTSALACFKYNFTLVTLYSTLGQEALIHGVTESEVTHIITSAEMLPMFKKIADKVLNLEHIIYFDTTGKTAETKGFPDRIKVHSMTSVEQLGAQEENLKRRITMPEPEDLAVIMYTSGSTGLPKGVMISHGNLMSGLSGQAARIPNLCPDDVYIAYLPLAHVLELSAELTGFAYGIRLGYSSPLTLSDMSSKIKRGTKGDASVLRPTLIAAVPVIIDRIYKGVWDKVNEGGPLSKALFTFAYEYKLRKMQRGYDTPLCDKFIFSKIKRLLGGRVRLMLSGGAPLSADSQRFMNVCFCCPVGQGYGLTETCGAGSISEVADLSTGRVGAPLPCNEIMLRDWLEGGYTCRDQPHARGEILIHGGNVTQGYYKNPEKTAEDFIMLNEKRWFCTGDIVAVEEDGCIRIIDRKKDLVKLQAGEYVSLGKVEAVLKMCPYVDNICVYGESSQMFTVALVVPNAKQLKALGKTLGYPADDYTQLCDLGDINKAVVKAIQDESKKGQLERFEIPTRIKLCEEIWTPDTDLVTDAFKLKRKNIQTRYQIDINKLYA